MRGQVSERERKKESKKERKNEMIFLPKKTIAQYLVTLYTILLLFVFLYKNERFSV